MNTQAAAANFARTISQLAGGAISKETAIELGRHDQAAVLAALEQGHDCLSESLLVGDAQRVFLKLASEAMGISQFLRAELPTVNRKLLAQFCSDLLYDAPSESDLSDDDLLHIVQRFGKDNYTIAGRVNRILADRNTALAAELAKRSCRPR